MDVQPSNIVYIFNIYMLYVQKVLRHPHIQMCMSNQNRRMDGFGLRLRLRLDLTRLDCNKLHQIRLD